MVPLWFLHQLIVSVCISVAYLVSLEVPEYTELALHEYQTATNMTDQFAALAAIAQNPGKTRDDVLADFYSKWQHDFLVTTLPKFSLFARMSFCLVYAITCFVFMGFHGGNVWPFSSTMEVLVASAL